MKVLGVLCVLLFVSLASCWSPSKKVDLKADYSQIYQVRSVTKVKVELCGLCIQFADQFINQLLNIILNAGVIGGCGELCGLLADKTGSKVAGEVCEVLCAVVGIKEFINIINKADLDPIYYCELLTVCPINDHGDAHITSLVVTPSVVPQESKFEITASFVSNNGTGTGETILEIDAADGLPLSSGNLMVAQKPGTYNVKANVDASPDPNCDPTQGPCEQWIPGNYSVTFVVCNGQCGSKHPHSQIYDRKTTSFTVTG